MLVAWHGVIVTVIGMRRDGLNVVVRLGRLTVASLNFKPGIRDGGVDFYDCSGFESPPFSL